MIDDWEIHAYLGVGVIRFSMTRAEARSLIGIGPETFRKGPYATNDTDAYGGLGLHLYYDSEDFLHCVMAFASNSIRYRGILLLNRLLQDCLSDLSKVGLAARYDDEGYWFDDGGFVLYAPDEVVKAVTAYRQGYYEEEVELAAKVRKDGELI